MADLRERVEVEFENIECILAELPEAHQLPNLSTLELAGVAALLHSFYNGLENILKQVFKEKSIALPEGASWHKDLIELAVLESVITVEMKGNIGLYLAFRHYFSHAYALDLYADRMEPLVDAVHGVYESFKALIERAVAAL